jgi:hypothetical protein
MGLENPEKIQGYQTDFRGTAKKAVQSSVRHPLAL